MKLKLLVILLTLTTLLIAGDLRYENGRKYLQEKNYEEALKRFESLVEDLPEIYQYQLMLGQCLINMKDEENNIERATEAFKAAYELKKDSADVAFAYAQALQFSSSYSEMTEVLGSLDASALTGAKLDKLHYLRGLSFFKQKDYSKAVKDLDQVENNQYKASSAYYLAYGLYRLDEFDRALTALETVGANRKSESLRLKHKIYKSKLQKVKDPEARKLLLVKSLKIAEELVKINPSPDNYYAVGQTALFSGDWTKAQTNLEKAAAGGNGYASYYLSFAYIRSGKLSAAESAIKKAEPELIKAGDKQALKNLYCSWGHIHHVRDDFNSAIKYYTKGSCEKQLALAKQGKKAEEQERELNALIDQFKKLGN